MERLVVRFATDDHSPVHWLVWSSQENEIIASGELENITHLASLTERAGQRPITVLVPGSQVLLKQVALPAKANRKALSAIPYMLEEELNTEVSELFFATAQRQGDLQQVAVVDKSLLQSWLTQIAEAGLHCDKMLPDMLALPEHDEAWSLLQLGDQVLLRQGQWQGLQGEAYWLADAISHFAKQQEAQVDIHRYSDIELAPMANVDLHDNSQYMPMQQLAMGAINNRFNLLQGEFKQKNRNNGQWHQWRLAATLAAIALLTALIDRGVELNQLTQRKADLQAQIEAEYKRAFPGTTRIVNVRSQMRQKMASLEQGGEGASVLVMMSQLANAFQSTEVKPQTLKFDQKRSELRMQAVANNFEALERFKSLAENQGFEVQQGAINNKDNQVIGSLSIRS